MGHSSLDPAFHELRPWNEGRGGTLNDYVFPSRNDYMTHMSSMPALFASESSISIIYKATGNLRAVRILLGHAKIESTVRYIGVDVEDASELSERTEV